MKPRFALNLSEDGIGLFHRTQSGWTLVGEVALDDSRMSNTLAMLRNTAQGLEKGGVTTALVIPDSQIKYLTVAVKSDRANKQKQQVRAALEGATPYALDELVFDFEVVDGTAHVAAVARETLAEAEAFAADHEFKPVSFVAAPQTDDFPRAAFFGPTGSADQHLAKGEKLEHDTLPVREGAVAPPEPPREHAKPKVHAIASETDSDFAEDPETAAAQGDKAAPTPPQEDGVEPAAAPAPSDINPTFLSTRTTTPTKANAEGVASTPSRLTLTPPVVGSDKRKALAQKNVGVTAPVAPAPEETPKRAEPVVAEKKFKVPPAPPILTASGQPAPPPRPRNEADALTVFGARGRQAIRRNPQMLGLAATVVVLVILVAVAIWSTLRFSGDVAQLPEDPNAGQAPVILEPEVSVIPPPAQDTQVAVVDQPAAQEPINAPSDVVNLPGLATSPIAPPAPLAPVQDAPELTARAVPPPEATAEEEIDTALVEAEATEIELAGPPPEGAVVAPPEAPALPDQDRIDTLYIASIDPAIPGEDAVAMATEASLAPDDSLVPQYDPPPAGSTFVFDDAGRVIPSTSGTLNPLGVLVFAGPPALTPPPRPGSAAEAEAEAQAELDTLRAELAAFRPRLRPENLTDRAERAETGGFSRLELSGKAPRARPQALAEAAKAILDIQQRQPAQPAAEPETAETDAVEQQEGSAPVVVTGGTVVASLLPRDRPSERAAAAQAVLSAPVAPAVPKVEAATAPRLPSSASVTKQATVENAINLRQMNLIGVFGTSSDRRALVRLPSGRYVKVQVGDRLDGGQVAAIAENELRYVKNGKNHVLQVVAGG